MPISPARKAAFQILVAVERGSSHSGDLLRGKAVKALSAPDRNLCTALVLGVLRWQCLLDLQLKGFLKRPGAKLDREVLIALRMGAFQLLYLDRIPASAAIDDSVELAKHAGHRFASGMVNAVLRKLAAAGAKPEPEPASSQQLALAFAHPEWMVERWAQFYGVEAARSICNHGQTQPVLAVRLASLDAEEELSREGIVLERSAMLSSARIVTSGEAAAADISRSGRLRIQDEGSQLVGEVAASAVYPATDSLRILDACAAPGGKTLILAERHPRAHILACEASEQRLEHLRARLSAYVDRIECRLMNAATLAPDESFDVALVDAPCSGTGTLGRNPEIRHRLTPDDLPRQAERQRAILSAALGAVRMGGYVVYSTCSLEPEENEQVIAGVLALDVKARIVPLDASIDALSRSGILVSTASARLRKCVTPEGALRLLPSAFDTDGFFIAMLQKIG